MECYMRCAVWIPMKQEVMPGKVSRQKDSIEESHVGITESKTVRVVNKLVRERAVVGHS